MEDAGELRPDLASAAIVGMGASAGGLEALTAFFDHMPRENRMAFVVVMHQHPGHQSMVPELLARHTSMDVVEVEEDMAVVPDRVHVAPPGFTLEITGGRFHVMPQAEGSARSNIDHFFRSLARDQKERAIAVILSGTGSDGTLGLKEIKAASGMVMVQDEASAKYSGMPHSAIATALVDYVLPVEECPEHLLAYVRGPFFATDRRAAPGASIALDSVIALLRVHTGNDFSAYKESTLRRRIERRMNLHRIESSIGYIQLLQQSPAELSALFGELLIGVTSFFRDPAGFEALGGALDRLLADRPHADGVRAWVTGCATGEEAYSVAIVLRESAERLGRAFAVQVFATDLDSGAIQVARLGLYPEAIAADITPERLERYFNREERGLRIKKEIRDLIVFASHNLLKHPPFTRVDLITCRNLLIYLNSEAQARILPLFHYALRPRGVLFLGTSESVGRFGDLFDRLDPKWKLFARRDAT
ncbi:MAG TPA: chemotaxis protein CheB, partial [Candidatus Acidoferrum sp.]|nr:chemotaxis protein CheB [Candidatus Acidoferrum sp.]